MNHTLIVLHPNVNQQIIIIHPRNLFEVTNTLSRFFYLIINNCYP